MPKVFVPNKSFHNFSGAEKYGTLVFLTEGSVQRTNINQLYREIYKKMSDAEPDDFLLVSSLAILNAIAASILVHRFGKINYLIFVKDRYIVREVVLPKEDKFQQ